VQGGISAIEWTVYGKIKSITKTTGDVLTFAYDATGNRVMKKFDPVTGTTIYTYYNRDAHGNVMASYTREKGATDSIFLSELHIYGSKRLGYAGLHVKMTSALPGNDFYSRYLGTKRYELTNHLGNVMIVFTDRRFMFQNGTSGNVLNYQPDVTTAQDYDPFGMLLVGRTFESGSGYRYGFNGKESDDETYGKGNELDLGARIYESRLGKFLSIDPRTAEYSWQSVYAYYLNSPTSIVDVDGMGGPYVDFEAKIGEQTLNSKNQATPTKWEHLSATQLDKFTTNNMSTSGSYLDDAFERWAQSSSG